MYFEKNSPADKLSGEEAKRVYESQMSGIAGTVKILEATNKDHPFCKQTNPGDEFQAMTYYDGTCNVQIKDNDGNSRQIIFWGNKGPDGVKAKVIEFTMKAKPVEHIAVITDTKQIIGSVSVDTKQISRYQIDT